MIRYFSEKYIRMLAGQYERSKLLVFNFHNIEEKPSVLSRTAASFEDFQKQVKWISEHFNVLPLKEGIQLSRAAKLSQPTACITLDDGYKSQRHLAMPLFDQLRIPATFFVSSGHLSGLMWNDHIPLFFHYANNDQNKYLFNLLNKLDINQIQDTAPKLDNQQRIDTLIKYLPLNKRSLLLEYMSQSIPPEAINGIMASESEVQEISRGKHTIGAHTYRHPILAIEDDDTANQEIKKDLQFLQDLIGKPIQVFAYPNGKPMKDYQDRDIQILINNNITYAVTTEPGYFSPGSDPLQIPRINLSGDNPLRYFKTVISAYRQIGKIVESRGYEKTC